MKKIITGICFLIFAFTANSQPSFLWAKGYSGASTTTGHAVLDASGNTYCVGELSNGVADFDPGPGTFTLGTATANETIMFISKLDAAGNFLWAKKIDGANQVANYAICLDGLNNICIAGTMTGGNPDFDPGPGTYTLNANSESAFILKLDASGNFIWAKQMAGAQGYCNLITTDVSGNVYSMGGFLTIGDFDPGPGTYTLTNTGGFGYAAFVSKLDASGNFVWAKKIGPYSMSGVSPTSMALDATDNLYTTGSFFGTVDFDPGIYAMDFYAPNNHNDIFILKLDNLGNLVWAKQIGGSPNQGNGPIKVDANYNLYTVSGFDGTTDFDPGPGTHTLTATLGGNTCISKLDSAGNLIWVKNIGGGIGIGSFEMDATGNMFATGSFKNTVDFDASAATFNLTSFGNNDVFILKLDTVADFIGAAQLGGPSDDYVGSISINAGGDLLLAGYFSGTADFDPGPGVFNLTTSSSEVFVYKMGQHALGVKENTNIFATNNIQFYPNPTNDVINIKVETDSYLKLNTNTQIQILNMLGQLVSSESMSSDFTTLHLKNLTSGLYFIKIINNDNIIGVQKIIKE